MYGMLRRSRSIDGSILPVTVLSVVVEVTVPLSVKVVVVADGV
jgi:hypothetical protein